MTDDKNKPTSTRKSKPWSRRRTAPPEDPVDAVVEDVVESQVEFATAVIDHQLNLDRSTDVVEVLETTTEFATATALTGGGVIDVLETHTEFETHRQTPTEVVDLNTGLLGEENVLGDASAVDLSRVSLVSEDSNAEPIVIDDSHIETNDDPIVIDDSVVDAEPIVIDDSVAEEATVTDDDGTAVDVDKAPDVPLMVHGPVLTPSISLWSGAAPGTVIDMRDVILQLVRDAYAAGETGEERLAYIHRLVERRTIELSNVGAMAHVSETSVGTVLPSVGYDTLQRIDQFATVQEALDAYVPPVLWDMPLLGHLKHQPKADLGRILTVLTRGFIGMAFGGLEVTPDIFAACQAGFNDGEFEEEAAQHIRRELPDIMARYASFDEEHATGIDCLAVQWELLCSAARFRSTMIAVYAQDLRRIAPKPSVSRWAMDQWPNADQSTAFIKNLDALVCVHNALLVVRAEGPSAAEQMRQTRHATVVKAVAEVGRLMTMDDSTCDHASLQFLLMAEQLRWFSNLSRLEQEIPAEFRLPGTLVTGDKRIPVLPALDVESLARSVSHTVRGDGTMVPATRDLTALVQLICKPLPKVPKSWHWIIITQVTVSLLRIFVPSATEVTLATAVQVRLGVCTDAPIHYDDVEGLLCALVQLAISPVEGSRLAERLIVLYSLFPTLGHDKSTLQLQLPKRDQVKTVLASMFLAAHNFVAKFEETNEHYTSKSFVAWTANVSQSFVPLSVAELLYGQRFARTKVIGLPRAPERRLKREDLLKYTPKRRLNNNEWCRTELADYIRSMGSKWPAGITSANFYATIVPGSASAIGALQWFSSVTTACDHMVETAKQFGQVWQVAELPKLRDVCKSHPDPAKSLETSCLEASARDCSHNKLIDRRNYPEMVIITLADAVSATLALDGFEDEESLLKGTIAKLPDEMLRKLVEVAIAAREVMSMTLVQLRVATRDAMMALMPFLLNTMRFHFTEFAKDDGKWYVPAQYDAFFTEYKSLVSHDGKRPGTFVVLTPGVGHHAPKLDRAGSGDAFVFVITMVFSPLRMPVNLGRWKLSPVAWAAPRRALVEAMGTFIRKMVDSPPYPLGRDSSEPFTHVESARKSASLADAVSQEAMVAPFALNQLYYLREASIRLVRPDNVTTFENGAMKETDEVKNDTDNNCHVSVWKANFRENGRLTPCKCYNRSCDIQKSLAKIVCHVHRLAHVLESHHYGGAADGYWKLRNWDLGAETLRRFRHLWLTTGERPNVCSHFQGTRRAEFKPLRLEPTAELIGLTGRRFQDVPFDVEDFPVGPVQPSQGFIGVDPKKRLTVLKPDYTFF